MKLKNINFVTKMKNIYIPPATNKKFQKAIENLDAYINSQNMLDNIDSIMTHVDYEGNDAHVYDIDSDTIQKTLYLFYLEWSEENDIAVDYSSYLQYLVNELYYYLTITPDVISSADRVKMLVTVCSCIYYFNKHHNLQDLSSVHNGVFLSLVTEIFNIIIRHQNREKAVFYINKYNAKWLSLSKITDEQTIDEYSGNVSDFQNQNTQSNYPYGIITQYEYMNFIMNKYQELLDWQYNWDHRRTIGLMHGFTLENLPYYRGIRIDEKMFMNESNSLFINFNFNHTDGITHIIAFRQENGSLYLSLFFDKRDNMFKLLVNDIDNDNTEIHNLIVVPSEDIDNYVKYKFILIFDRINNRIIIRYSINNVLMPFISLSSINVIKFPYYPEYLECALKVDNIDKYNINAMYELMLYDNELYPSYHNYLLMND